MKFTLKKGLLFGTATAATYQDIIRNQGVTDEAYASYVEPLRYHK